MRHVSVVFGILLICPVSFGGSGVIDVGSRKQLFIDKQFLSQADNVTLTVNPPAKMGVGMERDKPWESNGILGGMVLWDDGVARFYYMAYEFTKAGSYGTARFCYAQSPDGLLWEKPSLGQVEYHGSTENNILDVEPGNVFIDPRAPAPARYKMLSLCGSMSELEKGGIYVSTSQDGIHWVKGTARVFGFWPDGTNQAVYDPDSGNYMTYFRQWFPRSAGTVFDSAIKPLRTVGMLMVEDIDTAWPYDKSVPAYYLWGEKSLPTPSAEFATALACDVKDPPESDIYTGVIHKYEGADHVWLGFPSMYRHFPDPPEKFINDGLLDIQLAVSRDGVTWTRYRQPYVNLGLADTRDRSKGEIYMNIGMVPRGNEIYQYYNGATVNHGEYPQQQGFSEIYRLVQRRDGFVSVDAPYEGGEFTTPLLRFAGGKLQLNVDTSAMGQMQVEILDENGEALPGFSGEHPDLIQGNFVDKTVSWSGKTDVSKLAGRAVKLRFVMRSTKLYAFQFTDESQ